MPPEFGQTTMGCHAGCELAMHHAIRIVLVLVLIGAAATSAAQVCAGGPSFGHVTWQTSAGLEFIGAGERAGATLVGGRDVLFAGALANAGHSDGRTTASWIVGGFVGSDRVIHRGGRVHLCPVFKSSYTFGPKQQQRSFLAPLIEFNTFSMAATGSVGIVVHETATRQLVPTFSLGFARDRTQVSSDDQHLAEITDDFLTANLGFGFVFNDQNAVTPQITMAFKDQSRVTGFLVLATLGFGIR